jgi:hypothetical protein
MKRYTDHRRIVLLYNADSGLLPMLADAVKKLMGTEDCTLCEITHSAAGKRSSWAKCEAALPLPVVPMHRDEVPAGWRVGALPSVVLAEGSQLLAVLLDDTAIRECHGDPARLRARIEEAMP